MSMPLKQDPSALRARCVAPIEAGARRVAHPARGAARHASALAIGGSLALFLALGSLTALPRPAAAQDSARSVTQEAGPLRTIDSLDVPRYMGTWYEIALYPNRFQKRCVADTQATYRLRDDGRVEVTNRCRNAEGQFDQAVGEARQVGEGAGSPRLKVRFAPAWLSFLPMVWGDYWVIDLDAGYQLAAVSEPQREYLWILSRTPSVEPAAYEALLVRLRERGFDLERLRKTPQQGR